VRRLVLVLTVLALVVLGASSAGAAKSKPNLKVTGSAHAANGKLLGGFTVANQGATTSPAIGATVNLLGPKAKGKVPKLTVAHAKVHPLAPGTKQHLAIKATIPASVTSGHWSVVVCAGRCVGIGGFAASGSGSNGENGNGSGTHPKKATAPNAPSAPGGSTPSTPQPPATLPPLCPIPSAPIAYTAGEPFLHAGCGVEYWGLVPSSYNAGTPAPLLIWLHGCGGESGGDIYTVSPAASEEPQDWISLTLVGREEPGNECWTPSVDETKVMQALTDIESHLNVDPRRVILGGYSSGGDLAYRTGFRHSSTFAGLLIENSSPFRDTESTQAESLAAATTKFHIVHLAHLQDDVYPIAGVRTETEAVKAAGFPLERIEVDGGHYDEPNEIENGHAVPGTDADLRTYLLPHIDDGWLAP
jgi:pimeloyl-ACP methyl ester carboxylesterase